MGGRLRHHQRGRSHALGHHADRLRPHGLPGRQARRHRRREGRHPEARRAGRDRPPARGERRGDRRRGGQARRAALPHGPRMAGDADGRPASATTATCSGLDLPAPALVGAPPDRQCRDGGRLHRAPARRAVPHRRRRRSRKGLDVGRLAGPAAEADARAAGRGHAARLRAVARWRPQRGLRHRAGAHGRATGPRSRRRCRST